MTAIIAVRAANGRIKTCNKTCYDAKRPKCACVCGGRNHGVGLKQAIKNNREFIIDITQVRPMLTNEKNLRCTIYIDDQQPLAFGRTPSDSDSTDRLAPEAPAPLQTRPAPSKNKRPRPCNA